MTTPRTKYIDPDFRRDPHTDHFCCVCQRDIKPGENYRMVHIVDGGTQCLHPEDEKLYQDDGGDMYWHPIGSDCAKKLGLEWSIPNDEDESHVELAGQYSAENINNGGLI